jgi:ABC-type branched-subunit amino acid transport system substrate-binding protein
VANPTAVSCYTIFLPERCAPHCFLRRLTAIGSFVSLGAHTGKRSCTSGQYGSGSKETFQVFPDYFHSATTVASLAAKKPHYVFFFGAAADMTSFAVEMDRANFDAGLLSSAVMVGRAAFSLSPAVLARTYFSYPMSLPDRDDLSEFNAVMQRARVNLRSAAFQAVAYAAAKVFLEAVKNSDRRFSRAALVNSLEHLQNFKTGVIGLVTFGPNRRVGAAGSYIVGVDVIKKQFVPVSARIVPKGSE